jgi:protoporphyrinogen oxidase
MIIGKAKRGKVVVLGGGLAGLSALWHLQKAGWENSFLFEKESRVGGLTRSETVNGFTFDYTGHLLHFRNDTVKELVSNLLGQNIHYVARNSWILSKGVYTRYPFQTNLYGLPSSVIKECILGFIKATANGHHGRFAKVCSDYVNFEEWIYSTLGSGIATHFMVPYNEKLWTVPLKELTCDWMGRFVPTTSLEQILDGALSDQSKNIGYNAQFGYPLKGGIESLPRAFARSLKNLYPEHEVVRLDLQKKRIVFKNKQTINFDALISSMPMPRLVKLISAVPSPVQKASDQLCFTSVYNVNIGVDRKVSDMHWIYFPEPEFTFYRIGFSHNFSPYQAPPGCGSIYAEVAYSPWKPLDKSQIVAKVRQDLLKAKILRKEDRLLAECCIDIPCAYVLYDQNYRQRVGLIRNYLRKNRIRTIGRYGSWEYSGMEDAIWQGKEAAEEILK